MKKIGILFGNEKSFPFDYLEKINSAKNKKIHAELIKIGNISIEELVDFDLIIDRVSNEVPYYRSYLKLAQFSNVKIVNSPNILDNDDKFYYFFRAKKLGLNVPKTIVLPSKEHPYGTNHETMQNLIYPLPWESIFNYIGFPAYIRPNSLNAFQYDYKVYNETEFHSTYDLTGSSVMMLQESIEYEQFYRCYVVGNKVRIINYDPIKPFHLRFTNEIISGTELSNNIEKDCLKISKEFGLLVNSPEIAIKDGKHFFVELINPVPTVEPNIIVEENYKWFLDSMIELTYELLGKKLIKTEIPKIRTHKRKTRKKRITKSQETI